MSYNFVFNMVLNLVSNLIHRSKTEGNVESQIADSNYHITLHVDNHQYLAFTDSNNKVRNPTLHLVSFCRQVTEVIMEADKQLPEITMNHRHKSPEGNSRFQTESHWFIKGNLYDTKEELEAAYHLAVLSEQHGMSKNDFTKLYPATLRVLSIDSVWTK